MTFIQTELVHGLIHLTDTFMTIRLVDRIFRRQQSKWHRAEFCFGIFLLVLLKTRTGFESQMSSIEKVFTHSAKPQKYHQRNIFCKYFESCCDHFKRYSFWSKNKCREFYKTTCCKTFNKVASIPLQTTFHSASGSRFHILIIQKYVVWLT